jgi:hypothetical protein
MFWSLARCSGEAAQFIALLAFNLSRACSARGVHDGVQRADTGLRSRSIQAKLACLCFLADQF